MTHQNRPIVRVGQGWMHRSLRRGFQMLSPFPGVAERCAEAVFCTPPRMRLGPRGAAQLASGKRKRLLHRGRRVAVWSWGSGPAVYLVHGWGGRAAQLAAFVPPLVARGFSVVAVDLPAHGESQGRRTNLIEAAAALRQVVESGAPAHAIVAHSFGAAATSLALQDGLRAGRLALIGPAAAPVDWTHRFGEALEISREIMDGMRRRTERRLGFRWEDLDVTRHARGRSEPLLVVHDLEDDEVPHADALAIVGAWPGAQLLSTSGLGHRRILRDPHVVTAVVHFVSESGRGSSLACAGCNGPLGEQAQRLCDSCSLDAMLFDREARAAAAFGGPASG